MSTQERLDRIESLLAMIAEAIIPKVITYSGTPAPSDIAARIEAIRLASNPLVRRGDQDDEAVIVGHSDTDPGAPLIVDGKLNSELLPTIPADKVTVSAERILGRYLPTQQSRGSASDDLTHALSELKLKIGKSLDDRVLSLLQQVDGDGVGDLIAQVQRLDVGLELLHDAVRQWRELLADLAVVDGAHCSSSCCGEGAATPCDPSVGGSGRAGAGYSTPAPARDPQQGTGPSDDLVAATMNASALECAAALAELARKLPDRERLDVAATTANRLALAALKEAQA